jgi:hypothetical protein
MAWRAAAVWHAGAALCSRAGRSKEGRLLGATEALIAAFQGYVRARVGAAHG